MSDLGNILSRAGDELGADVGRLDDATYRRIVSKARGRRVRRHTAQSFAAVGAVAVLGTVAWLGLHRADTPQPAVTPTVSPSPTSTPSSTPTPTASSAPVAVERPGMPPMLALDDDVLARVGSGWTVVQYGPTTGDAELADGTRIVPVLALASPEGVLYHVRDDVYLGLDSFAWDGSPTVPVAVQPGIRGLLDLRTGEVVDAPRTDVGANAYPHPSDVVELWIEDGEDRSRMWVVRPDGEAHLVTSDLPGFAGGGTTVNPDGTLALVEGADRTVVVDLVAGGARPVTLAPAGTTCATVGWQSRTDVLLVCAEGDTPPWGATLPDGLMLVRVDVAAGTAPVVLRDLRAGDLVPSDGVLLPDGRVVAKAWVHGSAPEGYLDYGCRERVAAWRDGVEEAVDLALPFRFHRVATSGGRLHVVSFDACGGDGGPIGLVVHDPTTGMTATLLPGPDGPGQLSPLSAVTAR